MTQSNPILGAEASDITTLRFISDGFGDQYSACIDKDIVIVGAGMAGIGAALTLLEHGCKNFVLLEAQAQAGGRIQSVHIGDGIYLEEGAQWIHGQDNPVYQWAEKYRLTSPVRSDEAVGVYLRDDGSEVPLEVVHQVAGAIGKILEECEEFWTGQEEYPESIGHYLDKQFDNYVKSQPPNTNVDTLRQLYDWHRRFQIIDNSCDSLYNLSAKAWGQYGFCGGDDYINLSQGFSSVINAMMKQIPSESVRYLCPVKQILWDDATLVNDPVVYSEESLQDTLSIETSKTIARPKRKSSINLDIEENGFGIVKMSERKCLSNENNMSSEVNFTCLLNSKTSESSSSIIKSQDDTAKSRSGTLESHKSSLESQNGVTESQNGIKESPNSITESQNGITESHASPQNDNSILNSSTNIFSSKGKNGHFTEQNSIKSKTLNHDDTELKILSANDTESKTLNPDYTESKTLNPDYTESKTLNPDDTELKTLRSSDEIKNEDKVIVKCEDGTCYRAKHIVVTSSLGHLKENQDHLFVPRLPKHWSETISSMGFGSITKIFLVYSAPWWSPMDRGFQLIWTATQQCTQFDQWLKEITGFDVLVSQAPVLLGWVGGACAERVETLSETEIGRECTRLLSHFTRRELPLPCRVVRSSWRSNKYVRGAYSHTTSTCDRLAITSHNLTVPVPSKKRKNAIYFAGEALHEKYFSTTHGAFLSGADQAKTIAEELKKTKSL